MQESFFRSITIPIRGISLAWLILGGCLGLFGQSLAEFGQDTFPAGGRHETTLQIRSQGRYSIRVNSDFGVAIAVVDAMSGIMAESGTPGESDGRIDLNLEKSVYLIRLEGIENAKGDAVLSVRGFEEKPLEHPDLKPVEVRHESLGDLEQVRFRLNLAKPQILRLELMGRHLEDAVIWFPNGWTTGLRPTRSVFEPEPGKPMTHLEFHHALPEGSYELVCYGGEPRQWSITDSANPLYIRWDPRKWGEAGVHEITMSPFGRESFLLEGDTNFFEIVREDVRPTRLTRNSLEHPESSRFDGQGNSVQLVTDSKTPILTLLTGTVRTLQSVVVEAAPGDKITLRYFPRQYRPNVKPEPNRQYIATLHEAQMTQTLGATGLLWAKAQGAEPRFIQSQLLNTSPEQGWRRHIDLQDSQEAWVRIAQKGAYAFSQEPNGTASARFRLVPFNKVSYRGNPDFPFRDPGDVFDLAAGIYQLTVQPQRKGLLKVGFGPTNQTVDFESRIPPAMPEIAWSNVMLPHGSGARTQLYLSNQGRINKVAIQRNWPLALEEPLPLALNNLEARQLEINLSEPQSIAVENPLQILDIDNRAYSPGTLLPRGQHTVTVHNPTSRIAYGTLAAWPAFTAERATGSMDAGEPIAIDQPVFFDLRRHGKRHFLWTLSQSGLYRLETTGRLPTTIRVNSRTKADLFQAQQNGQGRNALVQQYFKAGEYVITVGVAGEGKGRLGFQISPNDLIDGGLLEIGALKKRTLAADQSVRYEFSIDQGGRYRIKTLGLGARFPARLEDSDGWPVAKPGTLNPIEANLRPGKYHYYSLATPTPSRRLSRIVQLKESEPLTGKGPHRLDWDREIQAIWRDGAPDVFLLDVSAPTMATFDLTRGMVANLEGHSEPIYGGDSWQGELESGIHRLEVKRIDQDDFFNYSLKVTTDDLIPGTTQPITQLPQSFVVKLAEQGLVTFSFEGQSDIRAELYPNGGTTPLMIQDDGQDDWNPQMNLRLAAGTYELKVFPVGAFSGTSKVGLTVNEEAVLGAEVVPFKVERPSGRDVVRIPFQLKKDQLVHFERTRGSGVNFSLSSKSKVLVQREGNLDIPLRKGEKYELSVWSDSGDAFSVAVRSQPWKAVPITKPNQNLPKAKSLFLQTSQPGTYRLASGHGLTFASGWEHPLEPLSSNLLNLAKGDGWLMGLTGKTQIKALTLSKDEPLDLVVSESLAILSVEADAPGLLHLKTADPLWRASLGNPDDDPWSGMKLTSSGPVLAIGEPGSFQLRIWRQTSLPAPSPLRVTFQPFTSVTDEKANPPATLRPGHALDLPMDDATKGIILSPDSFALCWENGKPTDFFHTQSNSDHFPLNSSTGRLVILNNGRAESPFRILSKPPYPQATWEPAQKTKWEKAWSNDHQMSLDVDGHRPGFVHGRGEGVTIRFFGKDGYYWEGKPPFSFPSQEGTFSIEHRDGWLSLWQSEESDDAEGWIGSVASTEAWTGEPKKLEHGPKAFPMTLDKAQFIRFEMDQPGILAIRQDGQVIRLENQGSGQGVTLSHYFQPGDFELLARPFEFAPSDALVTQNQIRIQADVPESPAFIANGETQAFQFQVREKAKVGLGLKSSSDHLMATLMTSGGEILAVGSLIIEVLEPGSYLFVVQNSHEPVLFLPMMLGLDGSKINIPDDEMRQYFASP